MALDVPERREPFRQVSRVDAPLRMGSKKLPAHLDRLPVVWQPALYLAQVDVLLSQIVEVVDPQTLVLAVIRSQCDRALLLLDGSLECGKRLEVLALLVMKPAQSVQAPSQRSMKPCLVRMRLDDFLEDVDGRPQGSKSFVVTMRPVLDVGHHFVRFTYVLLEVGHRWVRGCEPGPVRKRFFQRLESLVIAAVLYVGCADVVMCEGQHIEQLDRLGPGRRLVEEQLAYRLRLVETADGIGIRTSLCIHEPQNIDEFGQFLSIAVLPRIAVAQLLLDRPCLLQDFQS